MAVLNADLEDVMVAELLRQLLILGDSHVHLQREELLSHRTDNPRNDIMQAFSLRVVVENDGVFCLFAAKRRCLHLVVGDGQMVVECIEIHEKTVEVVSERTKHRTVTGDLDGLKEVPTKAL